MRWLQGSNMRLLELGITKTPLALESKFPGLSRVPASRGFLVQLWNYGSAAQFSGKRERSCWFINPLVLKF